MCILIFPPVCLSIFFAVVFKILVSSVTDMDNSDSGDVSFDVLNPKNGVTWEAINVHIEEGEKELDLPAEVDPGKINVKLMTY